ncbi:DUF2336 domain-containing protein [Ancylobacter sp. A5.8]|uniref:DUF2336 domain-containing protein n=1 Tax=Ancylobacter gelatini TaxID=2919920 RepID=UPI001F4EAA8B|nr:DUF2336 domain-containing protein [Ancylobacter gelatini]MCJ8143846.1 DUF2336 domain-containing protein [Ancylobacter gelatini]
MSAPFGSGLKVLIEEARRQNADTRPELLRLLGRLYLAAPTHDATEQARFATLAIRLIDAVAPSVAAPVVRSLAERTDLPRELALHLAKGPLALAGPILRLSPVLEEDTLLAIASDATKDHLAALSVRRDVSPALAKKLASMMLGEAVSVGDLKPEAVDAAAPLVPEPATQAPPAAAPPAAAMVTPTALVDVAPAPTETRPAAGRADYLSASPEDRALIVQRLVTLAPLPLAERVAAPGPDFTDALLEAARCDDAAAVASLLEQALGVSAETAVRIVADESGQALAVAARALGLSFAILSRVLFRLHPVTGRSAADMARLADMFDGLPNASAQHLVASWRGGTRRSGARPGEEAPSMREFAVARPVAANAGQGAEKAEKQRS